MKKTDKRISEVQKEGAWVGKLNYIDIGVIHGKGLYCAAIEGGRYKVEDWDNTLKTILN